MIFYLFVFKPFHSRFIDVHTSCFIVDWMLYVAFSILNFYKVKPYIYIYIYFTLAVRFNNHLIRWNSKFLLPSYQSTLFRIRNTPEVIIFYTFPQITDISLARWSTANQTNCAQSIFDTSFSNNREPVAQLNRYIN